MNLKLSIILPCYNVSAYISQCLNSIYSQKLSEEEFEVICVNDCSTDNTVEIIQSFQAKYKNLKLLHHDVNKNLGASRNTGFKYATGKYVWFVDSDDFLADECLPLILSELEINKLEIVEINSYLTKPETNPLFLEANYKSDSKIMCGGDYLKELLNSPYWGCKVEVWRRIFLKEFLQKNSFTFSEILFGVEDVIFFYQTFSICQRFKHLSIYGYIYRNDSVESITNSPKNRGLKLAVKIIVFLKVIEFFRNAVFFTNYEKIKAIETYRWALKKISRKIFLLDTDNLKMYFFKIYPFNQYICNQLTWFESKLILNKLLIKSINAIFVPIVKIHKLFKK
jgi:glycosyltransferase involved in cell wall biosynthesis